METRTWLDDKVGTKHTPNTTRMWWDLRFGLDQDWLKAQWHGVTGQSSLARVTGPIPTLQSYVRKNFITGLGTQPCSHESTSLLSETLSIFKESAKEPSCAYKCESMTWVSRPTYAWLQKNICSQSIRYPIDLIILGWDTEKVFDFSGHELIAM